MLNFLRTLAGRRGPLYATQLNCLAQLLEISTDEKKKLLLDARISNPMRKIPTDVGRERLLVLDALDEVERFRETYIQGRHVAQLAKTSPKAIVGVLSRLSISPVTGPNVDGCRQYFYRRDEISRIYALLGTG